MNIDTQNRRIIRSARLAVLVFVAALLAGAVVVITMRVFAATALAESTAAHMRQYVNVIDVRARDGDEPLTLPGTLQGGIETTLYARTSGYVVRWLKDIGGEVKRGELLAEISAPELGQQLSQAIAARDQSAASLALAKSTAERWESLRKRDAVTQQELDERQSAFHQAQANDAAARANVARLQQLLGFTKIVAPFDGVVTRRNIDVGDLIDGGSGVTGRALFSLAQVDPLRLYVYVPQAYAHRIKLGDPVKIDVAGQTEVSFSGVVARTARAIDSVTRTMQVEIRVPNPGGKLIAGSYAQVRLPVAGTPGALVVPTDVLLFRPEGTRVAVVAANGRVSLVTVKLGTDFGDRVEVLQGLEAGQQLISHPPDSLSDGDVVVVNASSAGAATPAPGATP
jgi:RND family efflux transporter MFP subunit